MLRLENKVCIITGSGGGFGEAIAKRFVKEGARVVIAEINPTAGQRVEKEIGDTSKAIFYPTDVTKKPSWEDLLKATLAKFGTLDIVINNAGTTYSRKPSHEVTENEWDKLIDINMKSIFHSVAVVMPFFIDNKGGVMVNTSSIGGIRAKGQLAYYGASKAFVNKITEALAVEYGPDGIRINSICPLLGYTGLTELFTGVKDTPEQRAKFAATIPLRRGLEHEDIANAAVYLCSDEASFITGVCLPVDGGCVPAE